MRIFFSSGLEVSSTPKEGDWYVGPYHAEIEQICKTRGLKIIPIEVVPVLEEVGEYTGHVRQSCRWLVVHENDSREGICLEEQTPLLSYDFSHIHPAFRR